MKKACLILVTLALMIGVFAAQAGEVKPGEEVTVTLTLNNTNAAFIRVSASYDSDVFELVSYSSENGTAGAIGIVVYDTKPLPSGPIGTVTLRVKDNAPAGTYNIEAVLEECYDIDENDGIASVNGGEVIVKGNETPTPAPQPVKENPELTLSYQSGLLTVSIPETNTYWMILVDDEHTYRSLMPSSPNVTFEISLSAGEHIVTIYSNQIEVKVTGSIIIEADAKPQYSFSDMSYNGTNVVGKLTHVNGTPEAQKLRVRVTFFIVGNYYMATSAEVEEDGHFEVDGVGPIEYITAVAYDKLGDGGAFGAADLFVN